LYNDHSGVIRELGTSENGPEALYQRKEIENILKKGLNSLPEDARTILILKEIEGLSYEEIADLLRIKKGTVSSRIYYARQRLRDFLQEET
jgi:RNA polymerase sigma-70 factor (ECF subfamily)